MWSPICEIYDTNSRLEETPRKKCQYCEVDVDKRKNLIENNESHIYIDGNGCLTASDNLEMEDLQLNVCPMCGRKINKGERK